MEQQSRLKHPFCHSQASRTLCVVSDSVVHAVSQAASAVHVVNQAASAEHVVAQAASEINLYCMRWLSALLDGLI